MAKCERIKCPKCEKDFGQQVKFFAHLTVEHGINDYLAFYLEINYNGKHPTCFCSEECEEKLPWNGWKKGFVSRYARGHNARIDSVYLNPERQRQFVEKRTEGYRTGRNKIWNAGKTKEMDLRVAQQAERVTKTMRDGYASGLYVDWRLSDPEKARLVAQKSATTNAAKYASGERVPWNKGKTKETDDILLATASKISDYYLDHDQVRRYKPDVIEELLKQFAEPNNLELLTSMNEYKNKYQMLEFRCRTCGETMLKNIMMLRTCPRCFSCTPKGSQAQREIANFIRELGFDIVENDRSVISPKELDIYVPSQKFAIEFNGLFWHSTSIIKDTNYHQLKLDACAKAGIRLFSVYEDEWRDKRSIVEGMIKHRLNASHERLQARKLRVQQLDVQQANEFFTAGHLEGYVRSAVTFGLLDHTNRVVAAMSLRRPFHARNAGYLEVARSCTLSGISVSGWLGKLTNVAMQYAKDNGKRGLMTYVDSRAGSGSGYAAAGWKLIKPNTGVRFWWTDYTKRYNRFKYKADLSRGMSQAQIAEEAGVVQIYGCSNSLWNIDC